MEERERNINMREMHQSVASHTHPFQGLNLQSLVKDIMLQATESHWPGLLYSFDIPLSAGFFLCLFLFLITSLLSGTTKCSRLILYISCPHSRINYFSKEPSLLLLGKGIRSQSPARVSFLLGPSQLTKQRNKFTYTSA